MAGSIQNGTVLYSVKVDALKAQVSRGGLEDTSPYDPLRSICVDHKIYTDSPTRRSTA